MGSSLNLSPVSSDRESERDERESRCAVSGAWRIIYAYYPRIRRCGILKMSQAVCHSVILIGLTHTSYLRPTQYAHVEYMWLLHDGAAI